MSRKPKSHDMDNASQLEIINLLCEDAEVLKATADQTDLMLALQVWQEEVDHYVALEEDRRLALGAARVTHENRGCETAAQVEEAQAAEDRCLAMRLAGQRRSRPQERRPPAPAPPQAPAIAPGPAANPQHANIERCSNQTGTAVTTFDCIVCTETTPCRETVETTCSHRYCRTCITKLFDDFINESAFPPRCCNINIPLTLVQRFLTPDFRKRFRDKLVEHNDPNCTYCSVPTCSQYLFAKTAPSGANSRYCKRCARWTCIVCKKSHVPWVGCSADDEKVLQLGRERGWKQCPRCKHLIELAVGCYHIRCRCSNEFCYGCGVTWKQCGCQLWDPQRFPHLNE